MGDVYGISGQAVNPLSEMRWWHAGGFGAILVAVGALWHKINSHITEFRAKVNGYTITKDKK